MNMKDGGNILGPMPAVDCESKGINEVIYFCMGRKAWIQH